MAKQEHITPEQHREQIKKFIAVRSRYETYATVLKEALEKACQAAFPETQVQARAKSVSSFAEKVARKFPKYKDAVNQLTDLCGARVIVQTTDQVEAVKRFVEENFEIRERDEKGVLLGEDKFGYRDMHYIIQLRPEGSDSLGIAENKRKCIGDLKAELQVRTWLQHAWADTLHDRLYKNPLKLSKEVKRTGNLLAALMEEGDRNYSVMAQELDGMIANYTAFADKEAVMSEIAIQQLILDNEQYPHKRPALALRLARLLAACGEYARVVAVLSPHRDVRDANRCELLQDLGYALCKVDRTQPDSKGYRDGCVLLEEASALCCETDWSYVPHLRKRESMHARVLSRLAWAWEAIEGEQHKAREYHRQAHEHEPGNPYYLAEMLGYESQFSNNPELSCAMRTTIREAIRVCRAHAEAGIELHRAYFTAGRLCLLLEAAIDALAYYARGIYLCLARVHCVPADAMAMETAWIKRLRPGTKPSDACRWVVDLLALATQVGAYGERPAGAGPKAIILAGGATSLDATAISAIRPLVEEVLTNYAGTVISGGTTSGVPGCAGDAAGALAGRQAKKFELIGYIPRLLPHDATKDDRYDRIVVAGESGFSPEQVLQSWRDLLAGGVSPGEVLCIGFGGGAISSVEYRIALALGASVVVAYGTKGAADAIADDPLWFGIGSLMPLPLDRASFQALLTPSREDLPPEKVTEMAQELHLRYVAGSARRLPPNLHPWSVLDETYMTANREQAKYAVVILEACGFKTRQADHPVVFTGFTDDEVERMAEMEHGRWNVERLRDGWRPGKRRDDARKIHDCLLPWKGLSDGPDGVKKYDRDAVRKFPEILAKVRLEVYRP